MTMTQPSSLDYRLPTDVAPRRYDLHLTPDLDAATFTGSERIEIEVIQPTDRIVMNAKELSVRSAQLESGWQSSGEALTDARDLAVSFDEENERVIFDAGSAIPAGRYSLSCAFAGTLNDKLHGFYRSRFVDDSGVERTIATTQFEETDARLAFPCFDEPDKKAIFGVTLDAPAGMLAVSNGPEVETTTLSDGSTRTRFGDTIAMSTYLVAFIVGPLEATPPQMVDGIALRVIHVPGKARFAEPSLHCAAHALRFYSEYFALPYPGEKLDLVALPDFAAGAMENLGCVTFREAILLADPDNTSQAEMERMAEVVEHEIAHMWFGDLVTMRWWNGIWLNEAFATYMALCCQDDYRPDWECFVGFSRSKAAALGVDGLHATRPIEFPVRHPDEAAAMFDVLTYQKGASVLWMLETYIGRNAFRGGVRRYLAANQYDNTETTDLWDAIELEAGDAPIRALMDSWIFQGGYPLVDARTSANGDIELSQQPFSYLREPSTGQDSEIGHDWIVPVIATFADDRSSEEKVLLGTERLAVTGGRATVLNAGGAGFYRVHYDDVLHEQMLASFASLKPTERFNYIADAWALALAGLGPLSRFFDVVEHLGDELDPHVLSVPISALAVLDLVATDEDRPALQAYARALLGPILDRVGWERRAGDEEPLRLLRSSLVAALGCLAEDEQVISTCRALFEADHRDGQAVDADLASAVLAVVTAHATRDDFEAILARYRDPQSPMDGIRHLNCLGALTDAQLTAETLELCRSEFRSQNAPFLIASLLGSRPVALQTWQFITSHFDELAERFPDNSLHRMLSGITGLAIFGPDGNPVLGNQVREFCEAKVTGARQKLVAQSLERLDVNIGFGRSVRKDLAQLLTR
jgi:puromycin-sensitive aminopeptidase